MNKVVLDDQTPCLYLTFRISDTSKETSQPTNYERLRQLLAESQQERNLIFRSIQQFFQKFLAPINNSIYLSTQKFLIKFQKIQ